MMNELQKILFYISKIISQQLSTQHMLSLSFTQQRCCELQQHDQNTRQTKFRFSKTQTHKQIHTLLLITLSSPSLSLSHTFNSKTALRSLSL